MKQIYLVIIIILLVACDKNEQHLEENMAGEPICLSPNLNGKDTRSGKDYSIDEYFAVCSYTTVILTVEGESVPQKATYEYNTTSKKLEFSFGDKLYYPLNEKKYQITVQWPDESTHAKVMNSGKQSTLEDFLIADLLCDTIKNAIPVSELPIYFRHGYTKIIFTLSDNFSEGYDKILDLTFGSGLKYQAFCDPANSNEKRAQFHFNPANIQELKKTNQGMMKIHADNIYPAFAFDFEAVSKLSAGELHEIKLNIDLSDSMNNN